MNPVLAPISAPIPQAADPREKLAAAAKHFEAIFVRQMLAEARKSQFGGDQLGGQAMDTFRQMQDERFADIAAERGAFGLAKMIEAQLQRTLDTESPSRLREGLGVGPTGSSTTFGLTNLQPLQQAGGGK